MNEKVTADERAKANGDESAYSSPSVLAPNDEFLYGAPGLTKRELFAGMIAQGLAPAYAQGGDFMEEHVAQGAVKIADALLKELAK